MRRIRIGLVGLVGLAVAGCDGGAGKVRADPGSELHAAAVATANTRSLRIVARHPDGPPNTVDYQAPDRVRSSTEDTTKFGSQVITVIVIGGTTYQSDPAHPGRFETFPTPRPVGIHVFVDPVLNARDVSRTGDTYRFTTVEGNRPVTEEAHLQGGYLKDLTTPYFSDDTPAGTQTLTFTDINQAPPVDPPPAAAIEPEAGLGGPVQIPTAPAPSPQTTTG